MRINGFIIVFLLQQSIYAALQPLEKTSEIQYSEILADARQGYRSSLPVTDRTRARRMTHAEYKRKCFDLVLKYQRLSHKLSDGGIILNDLENVNYVENAIINLNEILNPNKYDRRLSFIGADERSVMEKI